VIPSFLPSEVHVLTGFSKGSWVGDIAPPLLYWQSQRRRGKVPEGNCSPCGCDLSVAYILDNRNFAEVTKLRFLRWREIISNYADDT
jgi:hypothetical protein